MKCIKQIIFISTLIYGITYPKDHLSKPVSNQAMILFIRDLATKQVITNVPIQASYAGYFTSSNHDGQIIFPRKTTNHEFYLIITPSVTSISPILNNVSHLEIPKHNQVKCYKLILQKNIHTGLLEWETVLIDLTTDRYVPLQSIIIFADPNDLEMQIGITPTLFNHHLVLPSIYLVQDFKDHQFALVLPNNRPFLAKLITAYSLTPYGYATMQIY